MSEWLNVAASNQALIDDLRTKINALEKENSLLKDKLNITQKELKELSEELSNVQK